MIEAPDESVRQLVQALRAALVKCHKSDTEIAGGHARTCPALEEFDRRIIPLTSGSASWQQLSSELTDYYDDFIMPVGSDTESFPSDLLEQRTALDRMNVTVDLLCHFLALQDAVEG